MSFKITSQLPPRIFDHEFTCPITALSFLELSSGAAEARLEADYTSRDFSGFVGHDALVEHRKLIHAYAYSGNTKPYLVALVEDDGSSVLMDYEALRSLYERNAWRDCNNPLTRRPIRSVHIYTLTQHHGALPLMRCLTAEGVQDSQRMITEAPSFGRFGQVAEIQITNEEYLNQAWLKLWDEPATDPFFQESLRGWIERQGRAEGAALLAHCTSLFQETSFMHSQLNSAFYANPFSPHYNLELAVQHFERDLLFSQLPRDKYQAAVFLGEAQRGLGQDTSAGATLLRSLSWPSASHARAYANLGLLAQRNGRLDEARDYYLRAEREPDDASGQNVVRELTSQGFSSLDPIAPNALDVHFKIVATREAIFSYLLGDAEGNHSILQLLLMYLRSQKDISSALTGDNDVLLSWAHASNCRGSAMTGVIRAHNFPRMRPHDLSCVLWQTALLHPLLYAEYTNYEAFPSSTTQERLDAIRIPLPSVKERLLYSEDARLSLVPLSEARGDFRFQHFMNRLQMLKEAQNRIISYMSSDSPRHPSDSHYVSLIREGMAMRGWLKDVVFPGMLDLWNEVTPELYAKAKARLTQEDLDGPRSRPFLLVSPQDAVDLYNLLRYIFYKTSLMR